ncbi:hypothetical protein QBC47DRAFT_381650 [Echria macrotheca]|uniref:Secreted protein n=1 Tax=Echria macrotheca TaxID=438768 RepID=A0AAJ0BCU8_9PEZI|nr:hypothetical protein QBC47DRAFT_381650 [Echria macrotheca]
MTPLFVWSLDTAVSVPLAGLLNSLRCTPNPVFYYHPQPVNNEGQQHPPTHPHTLRLPSPPRTHGTAHSCYYHYQETMLP